MTRKLLAASALQLMLWGVALGFVWHTRGLFNWIGIDYGFFWAAGRAFLFDSPVSAYDVHAVTRYIQPLYAYYGPEADLLQVGPTPYPPIFVLLFTPFAMLDPSTGFMLWTVVNLGVAIYVLHGLAAHFPQGRLVRVVLGLTFFPLAYSLFVGQMTVILLLALYHAYISFEKGNDFRGGLWTGVLLLKPQYAIFLILVILLKRRWRAVFGVGGTGMALLLSSLVILGPDGLLKYLISLNYASGFRSVNPVVYPEQMISWRAFLINFVPALSETQGVILTAVLSILTAATLLIVWRGPWNPTDERFAMRIMATMVVTLLASFHSHSHGAALLLVPGMILVAQGIGPSLLQAVMRVSLFIPTFIFCLTGATTLVATILIVFQVLVLAMIVLDLADLRDRTPATQRAVQGLIPTSNRNLPRIS